MTAPLAVPRWLQGCDGAAVVVLRAQPGARKTAIVGEHDGALKVAVAAPPVDGKANQALREALAGWLCLPQRAVQQTGGTTSRDKRFVVEATLGEVARALTPQRR